MIERRLLAAGVAFAFFVAGCAPAVEMKSVSSQEVWQAVSGDESVLVLDVRTSAEYEQGHVPGAVNIPHDALASRLDEVEAQDVDRVIVYCERGGRARVAAETLRDAGFENLEHMQGDMREWRRRGMVEEKGP